MKLLFITSFFLACTFQLAHAQEQQSIEVIRYFDGSVFLGRTIEDDGLNILFELASTSDVITIKKIFIKGRIDAKDKIIKDGGRYHLKSGFLKSFRFNFGGNGIGPTMEIDAWMAKLINPSLAVGGGVGFTVSTVTSPHWESLPFGEVFGYGRYYLDNNRRRSFTDLKLGVAIPTYNEPWLNYSAGPLLQVGIGIQFATKRKTKWDLRLSQLFQRTVINSEFLEFVPEVDPNQPTLIQTTILLFRTQLGIGVIF